MRLNYKITLGLIFSVILVVIFLQDLKWNTGVKNLTIVKIPIENCEPQIKVCNVELDDFKISVSFDKDIFYLKPFKVSVFKKTDSRYDIESVYIDFKMKNMEMGVNRFLLSNIDSKDKTQSWLGKALLPICVTGSIDWFSELEIVTETKKYIITFPIIVKQATR